MPIIYTHLVRVLKYLTFLSVVSFLHFLPLIFCPFSCQHLETVIRQRIPSIISLINKTIDELNAELDRIGRPIAVDSGVKTGPMGNQFSDLNQSLLV